MKKYALSILICFYLTADQVQIVVPDNSCTPIYTRKMSDVLATLRPQFNYKQAARAEQYCILLKQRFDIDAELRKYERGIFDNTQTNRMRQVEKIYELCLDSARLQAKDISSYCDDRYMAEMKQAQIELNMSPALAAKGQQFMLLLKAFHDVSAKIQEIEQDTNYDVKFDSIQNAKLKTPLAEYTVCFDALTKPAF